MVIVGALGNIGCDITLWLLTMGVHVIVLGWYHSKLKSLEVDADSEGILTSLTADLSHLGDVVAASKKIKNGTCILPYQQCGYWRGCHLAWCQNETRSLYGVWRYVHIHWTFIIIRVWYSLKIQLPIPNLNNRSLKTIRLFWEINR